VTAEQKRNDQMRPYHALFSAIIAQAVEDMKRAGSCDRSQAVHWLMHSEVSKGLLDLLDIDPEWFRAQVRKQPWFERAYREARLFNPLLAA
jgi:hypothetical protein